MMLAVVNTASSCTRYRAIVYPRDASFTSVLDARLFDVPRVPDATRDRCRPEGTVGRSCTAPIDCDDGCFCNGIETCTSGTCVAGASACPATVSCADTACVEEVDSCVTVPVHSRCQNATVCDGVEQCDPANPLRTADGCRAGVRTACNDENICTTDSCDPVRGCIFGVRDFDNDGFIDIQCGGEDCDDDPVTGYFANPSQIEVCTNNVDDDCDGNRDLYDSDCSATNDTCESAQQLLGPGTYTASTLGLTADYDVSCSPIRQPDAVFKIHLAERSDLRVSLPGIPNGTVAVRRLAQCSSGGDIRCRDAMNAVAFMRSLEPGDYAIIVRNPTAIRIFEINVDIAPPTPPPTTDRCNSGTFDISGGGTVSGTFDDLEDDYHPSCSSSGARRFPDAALRLVLAEPKDVTIRARAADLGGSPAYVSLVGDCSAPTGTDSCVLGSPGTPATIRRRSLPAGEYFILVEPSSIQSRDWSVEVTATPATPIPTGDNCTNPITLVEGEERMISLVGFDLDRGHRCTPLGAPYKDVFFTFTLAEPRDVELAIRTGPGDTHFITVLRDSCAGTELRCSNAQSPSTTRFRNAPAGTYVVHTTAITNEIRATLRTTAVVPSPTNDTCALATPITMNGEFVGSIEGFSDDAQGCSIVTRPDAIYSLNLTGRTRVQASVVAQPETGSSPFLIYSTTACNRSGTPLCSSSFNTILDPGTHYLVVEAAPGAPQVEFKVSVALFPQ